MYRASSTNSLLKVTSNDYVEAATFDPKRDSIVTASSVTGGAEGDDGGGDDDATVVNENNFPSCLQNGASSSGSFIFKQDDFKVKDPKISIDDWICQEDSKVIKIDITDPHVVPNRVNRRRSSTSSLQALFSKNRAVYVVTVEGLPLSKQNEVRFVERTFKEFLLFREVLLRRFPASCPPPLPPSMKLGTNREQVVKKRSRMLCLFLQTVADHPFFRNDQVFELFVASPISFEQSLSRFTGFPSEGTERWRQALRSAPLPKDAVSLIENVRSELREVERKLNSLKNAAKLEVDRAIARAVSSGEMVKALDNWLATERVATSPLSGSVQVDVDDGKTPRFTMTVSLPDALAPLSMRYANHSAALLHEYGETQMETSVLDLTRFELATIATWLENLELAQNTERKVVRLAENLRNLTDNSQRASVAPSKMIDNAKKDLEMAKMEQARYQRGLLLVELQRLRQSRVLRAMRLKFSITQMHIDGAEAILSVWRGEGFEEALPEPPPVVDNKFASPPKPDPFDETKLRLLAMSVATKAVEESRAKQSQEDAEKARALEEERMKDAHKECKTMDQLVDMFWILVYCVVAVHVFFVLVFLSKGYLKESIPIVVLAGLTFVAGFLVELVHR